MMRILFVTGEYPPLQGGVGAYTAALARALAARGARVDVITAPRAQPPPDSHEPATGVTVHPVIRRWNGCALHRVAAVAESCTADWIHVQYQTAAFTMNPTINFAPFWWKRLGYFVAWTYHDLLVPYLFPKAGDTLRHWVTRRPAHLCDWTVVTNEGDYRQLAPQVASHAETLAKIPIGSNIQGHALSPAERTARRTQRGYTADDLVIGYFGFLNRSKGGLTLIRTLNTLVQTHPTARLLMIGERVGASDPTNVAYLQEVEALIDEWGLTPRVQWTGRQDDADVGADLNACDVLFMPYQDGASLRRGTLMAGLANGCAIVTTAPYAPLPELIDGRDLLYVPPDDVEAAARAIRRVAADPALAQTLRQNARAASQQFTWDRIAAQHRAGYERRMTNDE